MLPNTAVRTLAISMFMMIRTSIEAMRDRWANIPPVVRFLIVGVVLAAIGFFGVKPGYGVFKSWRMQRNLVAARKAVDEVRMYDARDLSLTVLRSGDPCIEAFRILEQSMGALRDPMHGEIARALMSHPDSSVADRLSGFRALAPDAPLGLLGVMWTTLPESCRVDPAFAAVFADRLIAEGRFNEVAAVLLGVPEASRTRAVKQRLVRVLIGSAKREGYDEAQRLIARDFPSGGPEMAEWLDLLEQIPTVSLQENLLAPVRRVLESTAMDDDARVALMLARLDYATRFPLREKVLEGVIERWQEREPELLADFLEDLGFSQRLLEIFRVEHLEKHPGLFPRLLLAMERTGAWEQAAGLLDGHGQLLPKFEELGLRAVVAAKATASPVQVQAWNAAMTEAKSSALSNAFLKLHRMAADAGMEEAADQAMLEAIRLGRGALPLYADLKPLLNSLVRQGQESTLLEICTIYLLFEPGNPVLLTQYIYLACLNNRVEIKTILKAIESLAKGYAKEMPVQMVLAMAYLCDGQHAKAAETLDGLELDPAKLAPGYRAGFLATQVLNGRMAKDDPLITEFPTKSMLPSERRKFREFVRAAGS